MPDNKNLLVPDEKTAWVVQKVFEMYVKGERVIDIVVWLKDNEIMMPNAYKCETTRQALMTLMFEDLQRVTSFAREHESRFIRQVTESSERQTKRETAAKSKELQAAKRRIGELEALFIKLFEENASGRIDDGVLTG